MKKQLLKAVAALSFVSCLGSANAALVNAPLPVNSYITINGLDWAWAFPLPASSGLDLSFQSALGWRLPTLQELANAPIATDFVFAGANVPLNGSDLVSGASFSATNSNLTGAAACATPYFSNSFKHCDWQDGNGQVFGPWAGSPDAFSFADQLVVRGAAANVPEPATVAMLGLGLLAFSATRKRKQQK